MSNINNLLDKFSANLRDSLKRAQNLACELKHPEVKGEHVLFALLTQKGSLSSEILMASKMQTEKVRNFIYEKNTPEAVVKELSLSKEVKKAIAKATVVSSYYQHRYIGTEHLLLGILEIEDKNILEILKQHSLDAEKMIKQLDNIMQNTSRFPDLNEIFGAIARKEKIKEKKNSSKKKGSALDAFGIELTNIEIQKTIDPVIGRENEIQRIIQILCRRNKNNPILLGEAGVGKTAIVEGLAKKIIEGDVPEVLHNKRIYTLDMGAMVGGAMFRGEFEARFKQVLEEIKEDPNIIVFIDEIHTIMGAGSVGGSLDAANMLKPALARGDVRCIGATTLSEYKRSIENDPALDRRFQPVKVGEPADDKVVKILSGIRKNYEIFHQVEITDGAIKAAVKLSQMYLPDRFLPDKAIDLIDEAAARLKTSKKAKPETVFINELIKKLDDIRDCKEQAVLDEEFEIALELKETEKVLQVDLDNAQAKNKSFKQVFIGTINEEDIAQVVSQMTQVPVAEITTGEKTKLLNLEKILNKKVIGQKEAVKKVSQAILRARMGVRKQNQPIGSFIFLGASGVGKTELAKIVAETMFGHNALIRIDMSEFAEGFNISKLIGAPAGYVGYKEGGKLSEAVKHRPYSVVLLDEIEKAHPDVFNLLLQILDEGHLTDASGKKIDFKNTIVIMTSNIGIDSFNHQAEMGFNLEGDSKTKEFDDIKEHIKEELKEYFRPEFLNRLDQTIVFNSLNLADMKKIVDLKIDELSQRLEEKNIKLEPSQNVIKWLAEKDFNANYGARSINRNVSEIEDLLAEKLLHDEFANGDTVKIDVKDNKLILKK